MGSEGLTHAMNRNMKTVEYHWKISKEYSNFVEFE